MMNQIEEAFSTDDPQSLRKYPKFPLEDDPMTTSLFRLLLGDKDLYDNYQPVLDMIYELMKACGVKLKAKKFEQKFVRTMFFNDTLKEKIDGKEFEITKEAKVHIYNCAETLQGIVDDCKQETQDMYCNTPELYPAWRKKLIEKFKKFDKLYTQHPKLAHPTINDIHVKTMKPLADFIESNLNLYNFE